MKCKKNSAKLTMAIVVSLLLLAVSGAQAATVIYSGNTATGIENLRVNGIFYDVEFVRNSADIVYGNPKAFDFQSGTSDLKRYGASNPVSDL